MKTVLPGGDRLNRKEAAKYLGVTAHTLAQWACFGSHQIPYFKLGKKVIYMQADLDAYLAQHRVGGQTNG